MARGHATGGWALLQRNGGSLVRGRQRRSAVDIRALADGAASGLVATVVMTGVLLAARRLGLVDRPAPEAVVTGMLEQVGLEEEVRPPARTGLVTAAHLGYGAALGAGFSAIAGRIGRVSSLHGAGFGLVVWTVSYLGWLPAVGIFPRPSRQGAGRHVENVAGHLVYGASLGWMTARLRRR